MENGDLARLETSCEKRFLSFEFWYSKLWYCLKASNLFHLILEVKLTFKYWISFKDNLIVEIESYISNILLRQINGENRVILLLHSRFDEIPPRYKIPPPRGDSSRERRRSKRPGHKSRRTPLLRHVTGDNDPFPRTKNRRKTTNDPCPGIVQVTFPRPRETAPPFLNRGCRSIEHDGIDIIETEYPCPCCLETQPPLRKPTNNDTLAGYPSLYQRVDKWEKEGAGKEREKKVGEEGKKPSSNSVEWCTCNSIRAPVVILLFCYYERKDTWFWIDFSRGKLKMNSIEFLYITIYAWNFTIT